MAKSKRWVLVTFSNVSEAIRLEKICRQKGISGQLIPTPRSVNSACSMSWRSDPSQKAALMDIIQRYSIYIKSMQEVML